MAVKWSDGAYFDRSSRCLSDGRRWRGDQGARETLSPTLLFEEARSKFWKLSPLEEGGFFSLIIFKLFLFGLSRKIQVAAAAVRPILA